VGEKGKGQRARGKGQRARGKGQRARGKGQRANGINPAFSPFPFHLFPTRRVLPHAPFPKYFPVILYRIFIIELVTTLIPKMVCSGK